MDTATHMKKQAARNMNSLLSPAMYPTIHSEVRYDCLKNKHFLIFEPHMENCFSTTCGNRLTRLFNDANECHAWEPKREEVISMHNLMSRNPIQGSHCRGFHIRSVLFNLLVWEISPQTILKKKRRKQNYLEEISNLSHRNLYFTMFRTNLDVISSKELF